MEWLQEYLDKLVLVISGLCILFLGIVGWVVNRLFAVKDDLEVTKKELVGR